MSIKKCTCKHDGQDKLHGKGMRVHNKTKIGKGSTEVKYRCTVCKTER